MHANYSDSHYVATAQKEVQQVRRKANNVGFGVSVGIFALNEAARMSMRARKDSILLIAYKMNVALFFLRPQNVLFWAVAPTILARTFGNEQIEERVRDAWAIHQNRQKQGLGATNKTFNPIYGADHNFDLHHGLNIRVDQITEGIKPHQFIDNNFIRWNENIDEYPEHHEDMDDEILYETDDIERFKQFKPLEKHTDGETEVIAPIDDETIPTWSDGFGETPISQPPTASAPTVDHGMDEDYVWAFRNTHFGQHEIKNFYVQDIQNAIRLSHVPFWGQKLAAPAFYRDDKFVKLQ